MVVHAGHKCATRTLNAVVCAYLAACSSDTHSHSSADQAAGSRAAGTAMDESLPPAGRMATDAAPVTPAPAMRQANGPTPGVDPGKTSEKPAPGAAMAMNECDLHTQYPGDEYCILPPPPELGFQLHIGPSSYDNPEAQYLLQPGQEPTTDFRAVSTNDKKVFFYARQFRMRPGAHHNIITTVGAGNFADVGRRIGTVNSLAEDSPKGNIIAPENAGVGIPLDPHTAINVSLHSINTSEETQLREIWVNFWYRDPSEVTDPAAEMFQTGGLAGTTFSIQPHQDTVLGPFKCTIQGDGRMLWMYGHRHANNVRFSTWRKRGSQRDLIYEAYDWEEPLVLEYASTVTNQPPNLDKDIEGGWNGILDMKSGDVIEWECHVINKTEKVLRFTNNTYDGEMCIVDAELVGANCPLTF